MLYVHRPLLLSTLFLTLLACSADAARCVADTDCFRGERCDLTVKECRGLADMPPQLDAAHDHAAPADLATDEGLAAELPSPDDMAQPSLDMTEDDLAEDMEEPPDLSNRCEPQERRCGQACAPCPRDPLVLTLACDAQGGCVAASCALDAAPCEGGCCPATISPASLPVDARLTSAALAISRLGKPYIATATDAPQDNITLYEVGPSGWVARDTLTGGPQLALLIDDALRPQLLSFGHSAAQHHLQLAAGWMTTTLHQGPPASPGTLAAMASAGDSTALVWTDAARRTLTAAQLRGAQVEDCSTFITNINDRHINSITLKSAQNKTYLLALMGSAAQAGATEHRAQLWSLDTSPALLYQEAASSTQRFGLPALLIRRADDLALLWTTRADANAPPRPRYLHLIQSSVQNTINVTGLNFTNVQRVWLLPRTTQGEHSRLLVDATTFTSLFYAVFNDTIWDSDSTQLTAGDRILDQVMYDGVTYMLVHTPAQRLRIIALP